MKSIKVKQACVKQKSKDYIIRKIKFKIIKFKEKKEKEKELIDPVRYIRNSLGGERHIPIKTRKVSMALMLSMKVTMTHI